MKKRYLRVSLGRDDFKGGMTTSVQEAIEELKLHFSQGEPDDAVQFCIVEMTEDEYDALPEFEGW